MSGRNDGAELYAGTTKRPVTLPISRSCVLEMWRGFKEPAPEGSGLGGSEGLGAVFPETCVKGFRLSGPVRRGPSGERWGKGREHEKRFFHLDLSPLPQIPLSRSHSWDFIPPASPGSLLEGSRSERSNGEGRGPLPIASRPPLSLEPTSGCPSVADSEHPVEIGSQNGQGGLGCPDRLTCVSTKGTDSSSGQTELKFFPTLIKTTSGLSAGSPGELVTNGPVSLRPTVLTHGRTRPHKIATSAGAALIE